MQAAYKMYEAESQLTDAEVVLADVKRRAKQVKYWPKIKIHACNSHQKTSMLC